MKKVVWLIAFIVAIVIGFVMLSPFGDTRASYVYVEVKNNDIVFHDLSTGNTSTVTLKGFIDGITPHAVVYIIPNVDEGTFQLKYIYSSSSSITVGAYDMPVFSGIHTDDFATFVYGMSLGDMNACAISIDGEKTCVPVPSDVASDMQILAPIVRNVRLWYDGEYFYYAGRVIGRFKKDVWEIIDENSDLLYFYALPISERRFILGGNAIALYKEVDLISTSTLKLPDRWKPDHMVVCGDILAVPYQGKGYKLSLPSLNVIEPLPGIPVGCIDKTILLFKGIYPVKGDIVDETGKLYFKDVSFGVVIGGKGR